MIPVYRPVLSWLREALRGPLDAVRAGHDMQIALVVDEDSAAPNGAMAAFWQECRAQGIEVHRFAARAGLAGNWNRCLQLARGHLVHVLHQDDRVQSDFYSVMAAGLDAAPDAGAAFTQHAFIAGDGSLLRTGHLQRAEAGLLDDWLEFVIANLAIQCPAIVVRRAVYEQIGGFDASYSYCADYDMWQRIATDYPLWFDPQPLADFRVHEESASTSLIRRAATWREIRRCRNAAVKRISPAVRADTQRSARRHAVRLARTELRRGIAQRDWRRSIAAAAGVVTTGRPGDFVAVLRDRYDRAPAARPPPRPAAIRAPRLPRIVVLTEFYPADPARCVFGAFQRLQRHLVALSRLGPVDVVFFWGDHEMSRDEMRRRAEAVKAHWPIAGEVRFIRVGNGRPRLRTRIADAIWALRGSVGFYHGTATQRTCRLAQVASLSRCLAGLQPDLIFAYRLGAAAPLPRAHQALPPIVLDVDDLEHVKLARLAASMPWSRQRLTRLAEVWLARHALRRMSRMAARTLVTSELDSAKLRAVSRGAAVEVVSNTAASLSGLQVARDPVALFVGTMAYPPNREAATWLLRKIWPHVRAQVPDARLLLAGEGTRELAVEVAGEGVEGLGFVADLGPVYQCAAIAVCPIQRGAGTRIKIIEAALNGRPVVSTMIGAEGLSFAPTTEILLDDSVAGFANACARLLTDLELATAIAQAALSRAQADYAPDRVADRLAALCATVIADSRRDDGPVLARAPDIDASIDRSVRSDGFLTAR